MQDSIRAVQWYDNALRLLDQRYLPHEEVYLDITTVKQTAQAIKDMVVRGAPAIGIAAAYGVVLAARQRYAHDAQHWRDIIEEDLLLLEGARPTAVNLAWAIQRMRGVLGTLTDSNPLNRLLREAQAIHEEDIAANHLMGELGAALIEQPCDVITHCNTGSLATGGFGTALGVIRSGVHRGKINHVYADETRPWLQGARLTAWELVKDRIPVTLMADSAAAHLMKSGKIAWVIVGSDRITANGDVANKIGTYSLAVNARYHGVKFMVVAPSSTVDMHLPSGEAIPIEQRSAEEVLALNSVRTAAEGASAWNPAFDVTPAELIDAIVTEKGVVLAPNAENMAAMMKNPC